MKQVNLKLPDKLFKAAKGYVESYGYRNIQELAAESMREKIFEKSNFDEDFTSEEINLIDEIISASIKEEGLVSEEELNQVLLK